MRLAIHFSGYLFFALGIVSVSPSIAAPQDSGSLTAKAESYLEPFIASGSFSGVVLAARGDTILLHEAYGSANYEHKVPNTRHTRFQVASISKLFTAQAIINLVEQRKLALDSKLAKYISDFPRGSEITIEHLLTHTSGIGTDHESPRELAAVVELIKSSPLQADPGVKRIYGNDNYRLLAYIIEQVSGLSYGEFLRHNILAPLGLGDTDHNSGDQVIPRLANGYLPGLRLGTRQPVACVDWANKVGNGSLYSSASDLHRWVRAMHRGPVLRPEHMSVVFSQGRRLNRVVVSASGAAPGFVAELQYYPTEDVTVVVLSNTRVTTPRLIARDIAAMLFGEPYEVPIRPVARPLDPAVANALVGRWQYGDDFFFPRATTSIQYDGAILTRTSNEMTVELIPLGGNMFFDALYWATIAVHRGNTAEGTYLVWRYDGRDYRMQRVSQ